MVYGLTTDVAAQAWDFQGAVTPNHDAGSGAGPIPKEDLMRFYQQQHRFYCGVDLHARTMYLCIVDHAGIILLHKNLAADPNAFRDAIAPYRDGLVVAAECMFAWYWLADLCQAEGIAFVLGQAGRGQSSARPNL
jgi:hypothetical protein